MVYERQFEDLHYALRVVDEDGALVFRPGVKKYSSLQGCQGRHRILVDISRRGFLRSLLNVQVAWDFPWETLSRAWCKVAHVD